MKKRSYEKDSIDNEHFVTNRGNAYCKKRSQSRSKTQQIENTQFHLHRYIGFNGHQGNEENNRKILQVIQEGKQKNMQPENGHEQNMTNKKRARFIDEQICKKEERIGNRQKNKNIFEFKLLKDQGLRKREANGYQQLKRKIILFEYVKKAREEKMDIQNQSDIDDSQRRESIKSNMTDISEEIYEKLRE